MSIARIKAAVRDIPDFPKPGILFKDITPILADSELFRETVGLLAKPHEGKGISKVAAIDARGFIFGAAVAYALGAGFVPIRKKGKLPFKTYEEAYTLEYGEAELSVHVDAFKKGESVILVDDLLATGGTAAAAARLIEKAGGKVASIDLVIELGFLKGREKLAGYPLHALVCF